MWYKIVSILEKSSLLKINYCDELFNDNVLRTKSEILKILSTAQAGVVRKELLENGSLSKKIKNNVGNILSVIPVFILEEKTCSFEPSTPYILTFFVNEIGSVLKKKGAPVLFIGWLESFQSILRGGSI